MGKDKLNAEFNRLMSIKSGSELYEIFFRLVQLTSGIGTLYFLLVVLPFIGNVSSFVASTQFPNMSWVVFPLFWSLLRALLAEYALRAVRKRRLSGTVIGLALSCLLIPSWAFMLGLFGFYSFLNTQFQRAYLADCSKAFENFLSALSLNRLKGSDETEASE